MSCPFDKERGPRRSAFLSTRVPPWNMDPALQTIVAFLKVLLLLLTHQALVAVLADHGTYT